jgi:hypothetical protein
MSPTVKWSPDSAVDIATGYGLEERGVRVRVPEWSKVFSLHVFQTGSQAHQPPTQWIPGALSPGQSGLEPEADHSSPTSVEVKNT